MIPKKENDVYFHSVSILLMKQFEFLIILKYMNIKTTHKNIKTIMFCYIFLSNISMPKFNGGLSVSPRGNAIRTIQ